MITITRGRVSALCCAASTSLICSLLLSLPRGHHLSRLIGHARLSLSSNYSSGAADG
ncbi:MAG: hypothetical protein PVSMB4_18220 [Ktedonobacterales bacterium]